ncbi:MAG: uroporphyrinogen-III synthase [Gammaproteobacteria bacterium]|nr:uroporphyrinogen-III synthase [Gammaproteobacteria bacterium]MBQ0838428.1 uroporphyrinogen-III synthase [Gammaproteobacteria bacterium]
MSALGGLHILGLRARSTPPALEPSAEQSPVVAAQKPDPLVIRLEALGAICHNYPVIKIEPAGADDERVKQQVMHFSDYNKAIVISQHAAQLSWWWLDRYWPMLPVGIDYFAVGPSSAQALRDQGVPVVVPDSGYSSEALLALPALNSVRGEKIIILRGGQGRDLLEHTLKARGARVDCCELYSRVVDPLHGKAIGELILAESPLVLIYSGQVLGALLELVPKACLATLKSLPIIVPGERVANLARGRGFKSVHLAASALAQDMEHRVLDWYTRTRQ